MSTGLSFDAFIAVGEVPLHTLASVGGQLDAQNSQSGFVISRLVEALQSALRRTYAAAALTARDADGPAEASAVWKKMGAFTDAILELPMLKEAPAEASAATLYDLALDYKLACQRRYLDCEREVSCLNENRLPAGLFPEIN